MEETQNNSKEEQYLDFLAQEYLSQKNLYTTLVSQYNLKITICGIIVSIFTQYTNNVLIADLSIIFTLIFIVITSVGKMQTKQIITFDCFNVGTFEEVITFNITSYNKEQKLLKTIFIIFVLLELSLVLIMFGSHINSIVNALRVVNVYV